jgi:hypothetical protein
MKIIIVLAALLVASFTVEAQGVMLTSGQSMDYAFSSLSLIGPADIPTVLYSASVGWADGTFLSGSSVTLSLFDSSTAETPFQTVEFDGNTPPPPQPGDIAPGDAVAIIGFEGVDSPAWQDLQGDIRVTVTSGSIEVNQLGCETVVGGLLYGGFAPVPEPQSSTLLEMAFTFCLFVKSRRALNKGYHK